LPRRRTRRAFLLETPIDDPGDDRRNIAKLWELAGLEEAAPPVEKGFFDVDERDQEKTRRHKKEAKKLARAASAKKKAK